MLSPEEYEGKGFLAASQVWQSFIELVDPADRDVVALDACSELSQFARENGSPRVLVRSKRALMLVDDDPFFDEPLLVEFPGVVAVGWLGRISYFAFNKQRSITWPLYDVQVYNTRETEIAVDDLEKLPPPHLPVDRFTGPLHLPVSQIDFAVYSG